MSVLESFYFSFAADSSNLKKGLADANKSSSDLEKNLQNTDATAGKLGANLEKLAVTAGKALAALFAIHEIKRITQETADHTYAVAQQARALDMNVESLSAWQQAVKASGGTADGATQSVKTLRDKFVEMSRFGGMMGPEAFMFEKLGVSAKDMHDSIKDPLIAMGKLAETFGGLSRTQGLFLGQKLGLDQGTINLLMQGRRGLDEMIARQKELGAVTEKQAEAATKFKLKSIESGMATEALARDITGALLPAMTWLLDKVELITVFMRNHKVATASFFIAIGAAITVAYLPAVISAVAATIALIAPFALVAIGVAAVGAAIALVVDDIHAFMEGGDSLIGRAVDKWPVLGQIFKAIGQIIVMAIGVIKQAFKDLVTAFSMMWTSIKPIAELLLKPFEMLAFLIEKIFKLSSMAPVGLLNMVGKAMAAGTGGKYDAIDPEAAAKAVSTPNGKRGAEIAGKLIAMGWSPAQAAGIAGSFMQESGGDAGAVNPKSGAYGLGQWLGSRVKDFKEFSGKDLKGSSLDEQLAFFNYETTHKEKRAGDMLRAARTAADAANIHSKYYERPGAEEANNARRVGLAEGIMAAQMQIAGTNTPLNSMSSQAIANSTSSRATRVVIGDVSVHTQATSGEDVMKAIGDGLHGHMKNAIDQYDDGIAA